MTPTCSKCGKKGHNVRTCDRAAKPKTAAAPRLRMPPAARPEMHETAAALAAPEVSVLDALKARRAQLQDELTGIDRKKRELEIVESAIEQIEEID